MDIPRGQPPGLRAAPVRQVPLGRPLHWLALGWRDFRRVPFASGLHGVLVAAGGMAILAITLQFWPLLPGAVSGFVLVGPILATGLYELSRRLERGEPATLVEVVGALRRGTQPLVWMGLLLLLAGTLWVLVTAVMLALFIKEPVGDLESLLRHLVLSDSWFFIVWLVLGGIGAAAVFAATVVSVPLLRDRDLDMVSAMVISVRAVGENPHAMALWAALIAVATTLSMATLMLGFVIAMPVIGHATWHCYRDLVDADGLPRLD